MAKITKVGGIGIPNIDAFVPKLALLTRGLEVLTAQEPENTIEEQKKSREIAILNRAVAARDRLYDYVEKTEKGLTKGAKTDIDPESYETLKACVDHFASAADVLNALHISDGHVQIKHLGGTITNKLNAYKGGRGDNIMAFIVGVTGNDNNGNWIKDRLKERGIVLRDNNVRCSATPLNYVLTETRDGSPLGDRHILKGCSDANQILLENRDAILESVRSMDRVLIEGSDISRKKFGSDLMEAIIDTVIDLRKEHPDKEIDMAFAPCTSRDAIREDPRNPAILDKACTYRHNDMPMVFNVEELLDNYLPAHIKAKLPKEYKPVVSKDDPYVALAMSVLKNEMACREQSMPYTNNQPIAIVSDSGNGLFVMTSNPDQTLYIPAIADAKVIDTTGAGDNLTAGAFIKATQIANDHRNFRIGRRQQLTNDQLIEIAQFAQKLAVLAIGQQGACIPQDAIVWALMADIPPPVKATVEGVEALGRYRENGRAA